MARRRRRNRTAGRSGSLAQQPWSQPVNRYAPFEILSEDEIEAIHDASMQLLEVQGMRVLHDESRRLLAGAGAEVDESTMMVRFDRGLVMEKVALAPSEFTLHARNPERNFTVGGRHCINSNGNPKPAWRLCNRNTTRKLKLN